MSYKFENEKMKIPPEYDRRRKLSDEDKEVIRDKYSTGLYSLNKLAAEFNVSKKTILLTVNHESKRKSDERIKEHWRDYIPTNEERRAITKEFREYKKKLYLEGKLIPNGGC